MESREIVKRSSATVPVVAATDVVVVGGGPAGISAAVSAARNGASVTLVERYPYLGGLASGGMVLVLDDMHNETEISVRGLAMEIIDRMHSRGLCVYPPEADRDPAVRGTAETTRKWSRWGVCDFHVHYRPHPVVFAAAFDPDGFKQASLDMVGGGRCSTAASQLVPVCAGRGWCRCRRHCRNQAGCPGGAGKGGHRCHGRS